MNIWIISKYASSINEGFESRHFALGRRFVVLGNSVTIISSDSNHFGIYPKYERIYNFINIDNLDVLRIKTRKYTKTVSLARVLSWIDFEFKLFFSPVKILNKPDIVIVSSLSLLTIINGIFFKWKYDSKLIFEVRDIWPLTLIEEGGFNKLNPFVLILSLIEKVGYKFSDLVVGTMPNLKSHVLSITKSNQIKTICVPFGFDPNTHLFHNIDKESFVKKYSIPNNKFIVGYAGSIGQSNALDPIIQASKKMLDDDRFYFVFLGDGDLKDKFISETKYQKNIRFISKIKRDEVQNFLASCDLLYFSARKSKIWEYGWSPNKLIDYMLSGKPILASYSGYKSMINEADSGFFVPAQDPDALVEILIKIISLPISKLNEMGSRGRDWIIKNRHWDIITENYYNYIKEL